MKKYFGFVCLFLMLFGCSSKTKHVDPPNESNIVEVDSYMITEDLKLKVLADHKYHNICYVIYSLTWTNVPPTISCLP